jgi:hypothetical protein
MAKAKVTQVSVSGLATNPNPNGLPAGSCAVAENVVSRRPGVLTPCPTSTALATIDSINFTTGKGLWSDADNAVIAVLPQNVDANAWVPGTDETQIGELVCYTVNQTAGAVAEWELTQLPVGYSGGDPVYRNVGFIPGITHAAFSTFRTMISEKWGIIASDGDARRWAGLPPAHIDTTQAAGGPNASYNWFLDGNSVQYRAHFLYESTDPDRPFEVIGPAGNISVAYATADTAVNVLVAVPAVEPILPIDVTLKTYALIYRSSQALVDDAGELPTDFKLVAKIEVTSAGGAFGGIDYVKDSGRDAGANLYTNETEQGEIGNSFAPPSARDVCVFRDTTFYANRSSLPAIVVNIPGALLTQLGGAGLFGDYDVAHGIGTRKYTGTATNGSTTLTITGFAGMTGPDIGQFYEVGSQQGHLTDILTNGFTLNSPWADASGAVDVYLYDTYTLTVEYADGTSQTTTQRVADIEGSSNYGVTDYAPIPSLRLFGTDGNYYPLPRYGATLIFIYTWPAIKRVTAMSVEFTNGQNYSPSTEDSPLSAVIDTRPNRLFNSKTGQPEAVPLINYNNIGAGTILKMAATQSALLVLCTDGLWRVTGDGTSWQVNQVDPTVTLLHPDCLSTLNNQIYGWVEDGLALIGEDGAQTISTDAVGSDIRSWATTIKGWGAPYCWGPSVMGDRFWNEVWLNVYRAHSSADEFESVTTLVYNTDTKNFTRLQRPFFSSLQYSPDANRMISQVFIPGFDGSPASIALTVQSDFYDPEGDGWLPATVWFNALQTDDKGKLKEWMDANYFVANVELYDDPVTFFSILKALFDARNTSTDPLETTYGVNSQAMAVLSRDIHYWVPRRAALSDQLQIGLKSLVATPDGEGGVTYDDERGFNFQLQGFTARYRIASDTLKR